MNDDTTVPIRSYAAFFPHYLRQHANPLCRRFHYVGTSGALVCLVGFVVSGDWRAVALGIGFGYGFAWVGHFFVEHNRPATLCHPIWSLMADHHMGWLALTGRLRARLVEAEVEID
jgi:hypothetical protein